MEHLFYVHKSYFENVVFADFHVLVHFLRLGLASLKPRAMKSGSLKWVTGIQAVEPFSRCISTGGWRRTQSQDWNPGPLGGMWTSQVAS